MHTRKLPLCRNMAELMMHRIVVDVVTVLDKISFVSDQMFPKAALP